MDNKNVLEQALGLQSLGWSIIPVDNNKKPLIDWKEFQERIASVEEIKDWFKKWPKANIAVVTGAISDLVVLDIDAKHNRSVSEFKIPLTVCSRTGGGGTHAFFRHPGKKVPNSSGTLFGLGVDVKGDAGYVVLPPSKHASGKNYSWEELCSPWEIELVKMPEWFTEKVFPDLKLPEEKLWQKHPSEVSEGARNQTAISVAGKIRNGLPSHLRETIGWSGLQAWNKKLAKPLDEKELWTVWQSAKNYDSKELEKSKEESLAQKVINAVLNDSESILFHDEQHDAYISIKISDRWEVWPCRSKNMKRLLSRIAWQTTKTPLSSEAIKSILSVLESKAIFEGQKIKLSNRATFLNEELWYDLTNENWQAVKITKDEWTIENKTPILFRRYSHNKAQVFPEKNGNVELFLDYVNITNPEHRLLLLVFLVSCFIPNFPHVMLVIFGAQGSSKSTLSKLARLVTDPSIIEVASLPNSTKELIQVLAHHYLIFFDNLSYISEEQSDTICKAITGSGFAKRELYENDEDIIYSFMRSIGINGINLVATRPDLLERSLLIELQRIDPIKRRSERELQEKFAKDLPVILGGIFDALVKTLRIRPTLEIDSLPRMADWSLWGCAIAEALGYSKEEFLSAYRKNIDHQVEMLLNENIVATAVVTFMEDKEEWRSTPTDFLTALKNHASLVNIDTQEKYWPKGANALSRKLNELSTPLKQMGILITISTSGTERWILIQKAPQNKPDQSDDTDGIPQIKQSLW